MYTTNYKRWLGTHKHLYNCKVVTPEQVENKLIMVNPVWFAGQFVLDDAFARRQYLNDKSFWYKLTWLTLKLNSDTVSIKFISVIRNMQPRLCASVNEVRPDDLVVRVF